jgi:hypothetical protein
MEASWERKHTDNELTNISSRSASATELYLMRPPPEKYLCTVRLDYYFQIDVTLQAKKRARGYTEAPETILITAETRQSQMRPTSETTVCIPLGDTASCAHQCVYGVGLEKQTGRITNKGVELDRLRSWIYTTLHNSDARKKHVL